MNIKTVSHCFASSAALLVLASVSSLRAELIVGLTTSNALTTFDSATPGTTTPLVPITGLLGGDTLVGIDRRPQNGANNGLLYGLGVSGTTGRVYTLNVATGAATFVSLLNVGVSGVDFGIDFNPVVDRLRVVSNANQNLRINVDTGVTLVDTSLAYAAGDANAAVNPSIVAAAYSNNFGGATSTVLRVLDSNLNTLAIQNPPNSGTLNTQFPLGVDFSNVAGYDISGLTGTPYASLNLVGQSSSGFYTLSGGGAALVGSVGTGFTLRDIAAPVGAPVPTPDGGPSVAMLVGLGMVFFAARKQTPPASA